MVLDRIRQKYRQRSLKLLKTVLLTLHGIREAGDKIVEINEQPIERWQSVVELIRANPETSINVSVLRNGVKQQLVLTPKSRELSDGSTIGYAGIAQESQNGPEDYHFELQFGVIESVGKAFDKTGQIIGLTLTMLKESSSLVMLA